MSDPERLVAPVREVARGGAIIDPKVVETLVAALGISRPKGRPRPISRPLAGVLIRRNR